jgi:hypothetical protein
MTQDYAGSKAVDPIGLANNHSRSRGHGKLAKLGHRAAQAATHHSLLAATVAHLSK